MDSVLDVFKNPQQSITKRFVQQVTEPEETRETIEHLIKKYPRGKVIQLSFVGDAAEQPIITNLIKSFDVVVNIIQGKITHAQNGSYGTLFIHLDGESNEIQNAIDYIHSQQVGVEVIDNG